MVAGVIEIEVDSMRPGRSRPLWFFALGTCLALVMCASPPGPRTKELVVRGATVWTGLGAAPSRADIRVVDGVIDCIDTSCAAAPDAAIVDAAGLSAIPGLIDMHVHFYAPLGPDATSAWFMLRMMWDAPAQRPAVRRAFLASGVTTIRSVGDISPLIYWLSESIESRGQAGPRAVVAGPHLTAVGGHPASTIYRNSWFLRTAGTSQLNDVETARREVRSIARAGASGIKLVYEGRSTDRPDGMNGCGPPRMRRDVLEAATDEAKKLGLWVAVHTGSEEEVEHAVLAGADTIEHGVTGGIGQISAELLGLAKAQGVTWVPTLAVIEATAKGARLGMGADDVSHDMGCDRTGDRVSLDLLFLQPTEDDVQLLVARTNQVHRAGIPIAAGTDALGQGMRFGESIVRELELLVAAGLSPSEAISAATSNAASALRRADIGALRVGARADLVLIAGQPWVEISDLRNVRVVLRGGQVVYERGRSIP